MQCRSTDDWLTLMVAITLRILILMPLPACTITLSTAACLMQCRILSSLSAGGEQAGHGAVEGAGSATSSSESLDDALAELRRRIDLNNYENKPVPR